MLSFFNKHFKYSKRELQGINVLLVVIAVLLIIPTVYNKFGTNKTWNFDAFEEQIDQFIAGQNKMAKKSSKRQYKLELFNPNKADYSFLIRLGFTKKQANTIISYRKAGGKFTKASDLKKVYGINQSDYNRVKDFISIPKNVGQEILAKEEGKESKEKGFNYKDDIPIVKEEIIKLNLNEIDSVALLSIHGIGPVFAKRIVNYRNFIGGFYSLSQLLEVYGFNNELLSKVTPYLTVDSTQVVLLNLNTSNFKAINRHPYFNYKQTKAIFKYRDLMSEFKSIDELLKNNLVDTITFNKIRPYLSLN